MVAEQEQSREDFLQSRKSGIGGSDVASIFNIGYGCALRLFRDKRGDPPDIPFADNGPMKLGRWLEPHIAEEYRARTGREVITRGLITHPQYPEALVHIDREIRDPEIAGPGVLEIKALGRGMFFSVKREGMPDDYNLQLAHGMLTTGFKWAAFVCMNRDSGEIWFWDVKRDDEICDLILEAVLGFWQRVKDGGPEPPALPPDASQCQTCCYSPSCQGKALALSVARDKNIVVDESFRELRDEFLKRKLLFDEAEGLLNDTKEEIRTKMGDREAILVAGKPTYYRWQSPAYYNNDRMAEALALARGKVDYNLNFVPAAPVKIEAEFKDPRPSRPLRVY